MNDCLFEPSYSTFTISLLARPRCPTGRVIRIYSVHFQSQLYLSQSFVSGAPRLELGPTVLETAMLPLTPCSYYQRRGQELHLRLVVLQTTPSLFGYLVKKCSGCGRIRTHGVPYRNSLDFKSSALNQLSHASIKYVYLPSALITQYTSLRTRYVTISSGYVLSAISIVLVTCYPRRCCTQSR